VRSYPHLTFNKMKKIRYYITLVLFMGIINTGCAQKRVNDIEIVDLKGSVFSVDVKYYTFEFNDSVVSKKIKTWDFGEARRTPFYVEFTKQGFYAKRLDFFSAESRDTNYYFYDKNGFLRDIIAHDTTHIVCDKYGRAIEVKLSGGTTLSSGYDKKGNLINNKFVDENGVILSNYKAKFRDNKLVSERRYGERGKLNSVREYEYNSDSNTVEITDYLYPDKTSTKTIAYMNTNSDVVKMISFDESGKKYKTTTFVYEYDSNKNWVKCYEYKNGVPELLTERIITYHNE